MQHQRFLRWLSLLSSESKLGAVTQVSKTAPPWWWDALGWALRVGDSSDLLSSMIYVCALIWTLFCCSHAWVPKSYICDFIGNSSLMRWFILKHLKDLTISVFLAWKFFFFFFPIGKKPIRIISLSTKISEVHINMLFWCDF